MRIVARYMSKFVLILRIEMVQKWFITNECNYAFYIVHGDFKGEYLAYRIPWQGDATNIISQYDVRINMDYIPDYSKIPEKKYNSC